ncbi:MAG: hypothetical protein MH132_08380 [Hydrotalea sp.]|jgi:hypothetical protein|nr:hypothetical protein [Hydrotalea sp.]
MMRKIILIILVFTSLSISSSAQLSELQEQLYFHSSNGLSFVPTLTKPGMIYKGKLYTGRNLQSLIYQINDPNLESFYRKYKRKRDVGNALVYTGTIVGIANIFISARQGSVNWWIIGGIALLNAGGGAIKNQAQLHLLQGAMYYQQTQPKVHQSTLINQPYQLNFSLPIRYGTKYTR